MQLTVINPTSKSKMTISDDIFADQKNPFLFAQALRVYLSRKRQGTSCTKNRSAVLRTSRKIYRQKGTGNARHGDKTANIFVGGATAHGPRGNRNWTLKLTKVLKKQTLRLALSLQKDKILVTDTILAVKGKAKDAAVILKKLAADQGNTLLVISKSEELIYRSFNNLQKVQLAQVDNINAFNVAWADKIFFTKEAIKKLEIRLAVKQPVKDVLKNKAKKSSKK